MPQPVLTDMKTRLEAAGREVRETKEAHSDALELRNELIVAAVDQGMAQRAVARAAGVSISRVTAVLLWAGGDDED